ncbi:MAG: histidine kinase [Chitinophagaceae bacterium]|nr:histidine kinase [Chitinophagaceae bacterium]
MDQDTRKQRTLGWLLKYKLHHIPLWVLYHYLWWTVAVANPLKAATSIISSPLAVEFIFYVVFQAAAVYINLYCLVPRYLEKSRFLAYSVLLSSVILTASLSIVGGYYMTAWISHHSVSKMFGAGTCFFYFFGIALPSTVASVTLALSIKMIIERSRSLRRHRLQEKERLQAELQFLKHQFNPHFLFNSINAIFFLINTDPKKASASLSKFSDLLRHQLYDCNDDFIPLNKEISYLQNFVDLEKLRRKNLDVVFRVVTAYTGHLHVAPFILLTFVENAFKHVSRYKYKPNRVLIDLSLEGRQLHFSVFNTIGTADESAGGVHQGGIGLQNVLRRLKLVYGEHDYSLDIEQGHDSFRVKLCLKLGDHIASAITPTPPGKTSVPAVT